MKRNNVDSSPETSRCFTSLCKYSLGISTLSKNFISCATSATGDDQKANSGKQLLLTDKMRKIIWLNKIKITEYLDIDLETDQWVCNRCNRNLGSARTNYKTGCLVYDRDPREVYQPVVEGDVTFAPDPNYCRILEFYCPSCGVMLECEALPPGHPITMDIELDIDGLKARRTQT